MDKELDNIIEKIVYTCESWIKRKNGFLFLEDPIEKKEISAHYAVSHISVAFIIYGTTQKKDKIFKIGYELLENLLFKWSKICEMLEFHNDFNNFALCVVEKYLDSNRDKKLLMKIRKIVLKTPDSNHQTINWLPMRAYVNLCRYNWSKEKKFYIEYQKCRKDIKAATFEDGFIEDRLPKGLSFNLQYDIATVAVMQFMKSIDLNIDLANEFNALINVISPDGDINYLGRGTNQIFAWGLWIYLVSSAGDLEYKRAVNYLKERVDIILKNNNLILNNWKGQEKYLWWDYHYCSVYTAHLLFWLILAQKDYKKYPIYRKKDYNFKESGIEVKSDHNFFIAIFNGRNEYLAEKGPIITNLWINGIGNVVKGSFGPWQGSFGKKYLNIDVINNFFGLMKVDYNTEIFNNRILKKLNIHRKKEFIKYTPYFLPINIEIKGEKLIIKWISQLSEEKYLNIPVLYKSKEFLNNIKLFVDNINIPLEGNMMIKNQYDWCLLVKSRICTGKEWKLEIKNN